MKKKTVKKLLALTLTMAMVFGIAACGSKETEAPAAEAPAAGEEETEAPAETGGAEEKIVIAGYV